MAQLLLSSFIQMGEKCGERGKKSFTVKSQKDLPFLWTIWIKVQIQTLNKVFLQFGAVAAILSQMRQARLLYSLFGRSQTTLKTFKNKGTFLSKKNSISAIL